jgi:hypothetical protein
VLGISFFGFDEDGEKIGEMKISEDCCDGIGSILFPDQEFGSSLSNAS